MYTTTIVSDSKYAIINFAKDCISLMAINIVENVHKTSPLLDVDMVWVLAHSGNTSLEHKLQLEPAELWTVQSWRQPAKP